MKKHIALILSVTLAFSLLTSCQKEKILDMQQAVINIQALEITENGATYPLFSNMLEVDSTTNAIYNIDLSLLEEYHICLPMIIVKSNLYIIAKPVAGKEAEAIEMFEAFMANYELQWQNYLPDQYQLVVNRVETNIDGYIVYIISTDNDAVLKAIEAARV